MTGSYRSSDDANIPTPVSKFGCLQFVYRTLHDTDYPCLFRHTLLKYGSGKHPRGKRALPTMADPRARMQRIDELKQMYREATSSDKGQI